MELVKARNDFCHRNDLDDPPVTIDIALSNSNICDVIDRFRADLDRYESLDQSYSPIVAAVKLDKRGKIC